MNASHPSQRSPHVSTALGGGTIAVLAVGAIFATLVCGGVVAVTLFWTITRAPAVLEQANLPVPVIAPPVATSAAVNDWWIDRVLAQVYTTALDTVVTDERVLERLGEDVGVDIDAAELYRRQETGPLAKVETIEFEIAGSKGKGTVTVSVSGSENMELDTNLQFTEITVTLSDGSAIDVPLPSNQAVQIR
jgi:hypothetical protein